ncbi:hypothetical protein AAKU67_003874 [Oxalobacteraceae bacterium GrIS 2.11]
MRKTLLAAAILGATLLTNPAFTQAAPVAASTAQTIPAYFNAYPLHSAAQRAHRARGK